MKILLLNPPLVGDSNKAGIFPPLGLAYVAAVLRKKGHQVKIADYSLGKVSKTRGNYYWYGKKFHEIKKGLLKQDPKPDLIGLGCFFSIRFFYTLELAKVCKKVFPKTPIVIGGIHATVSPESVLRNPEINYVVLGEGEETIVELIKAIKGKRGFEKIDGLAYKNKTGKIVINPKTKFIKNLDQLPLPARDLLNMEAYISDTTIRWNLNQKRHASVFTSRGCPNRCTFCSMYQINSRSFRPRSPNKVVDEIEKLIRKYNIEQISFEDDNLTFDQKRIIEICKQIIKRKLKFEWNTPNGISVKTLNWSVLSWMKKAGCVSVNIAVESGDPYILNQAIRKGVSLIQTETVIRLADKLGLIVNAYFVLGMPGETKESVKNSIKFACRLPIYEVGIAFATPFRGTELYDLCLKKKYVPKNIEELMMQKGFRIYGTPIIETPLLSKQELLQLKRNFFIQFHLNKLARRPFSFIKYIRENTHLFLPGFKYLKKAIR